MNKECETVKMSRSSLKDFCRHHDYLGAGTVGQHRQIMDLADSGDVDVREVAMMIVAMTDYANLPDSSYRVSHDVICAQIRQELGALAKEEEAAMLCAENHPELVEKIIEVSAWSAVITQKVTKTNCVLLESFEKDGCYSSVVFRVNGIGFTIDFENHIASRNTAYDLAM